MTAPVVSIGFDPAFAVSPVRDTVARDLMRVARLRCPTLEGPYGLTFAPGVDAVGMTVFGPGGGQVALDLPLRPLRRQVLDYLRLSEAFMAAADGHLPHRFEAIDLGKRALHDDAAQALQDLMKDHLHMDLPTARHFFTLVCVLWPAMPFGGVYAR